MKLVVGLGNPGEKYRLTRHNVGFMVTELLARRYQLGLKKKGYQGIYAVGRIATSQATLLLPQTFMNLSGASVTAAYRSLGIVPGDLIVIHDELDLPFGRLKIRPGGGHGGHNGIRDIIQGLGLQDFIRVRIGIGRPDHGNVTAHVLNGFTAEEKKHLPLVLDAAADAVEKILTDDASAAMNLYNGYHLNDS